MADKEKTQGGSSFMRLFLYVSLLFLFLPNKVFADPLVLERIIDGIETLQISAIANVKLEAGMKTDNKGNLVVRCLNLFSVPVAQQPFSNSPGLKKIADRTQFSVRQKGKGLYVMLAIAF